jgi:uncharacterized protein
VTDVYLLDANVLIALTVAEHEHHDRATVWLLSASAFAICPVVEGALLRFLLRIGEAYQTGRAVLQGVRAAPQCVFWPDSLSYLDVEGSSIRGHREVTDAYLTALARAHGGRLATLDRALATRHPRDCLLVP